MAGRRILNRLALAFVISLIFAFLPNYGLGWAIGNLVKPTCHPCIIFGGDVGELAYEALTVGWLSFFGALFALGMFVMYLIVTIAIRAFSAGRTASAGR